MKKIITRRKHNQLPVSLRTSKDENAYLKAKAKGNITPLHTETRLKEWQYWMLIDNKFPYSTAFKVHHMLLPKRVATREELNELEEDELQQVLGEVSQDYDCYLINFRHKQSIRNHFHIHLLTYKDSRNELSL